MKDLNKKFVHYVSQDIVGMIGISAYILADTVFIGQAKGADGITALNLILPVYSLIYAIGSMLAVGSSTRFRIARARKDKDSDLFFSNAILVALILSLFFIIVGLLMPEKVVRFMGGDEEIVAVGKSYTRIFMAFAPFFMLNSIMNSFVRNDDDPTGAMLATFTSSIFNIVMDYILMFPGKMGMNGAALATALSPIVGMMMCMRHFLSKKNTVRFVFSIPSIGRMLYSVQLGVAAFMGETATGITTVIFNTLILRLAGNTGVAAYGVIANMSIVAVAIFNGISQGSQPLFSEYFGKGDEKSSRHLLHMAVGTAFGAAVMILLITNFLSTPLISLFNGENDSNMAKYATMGIRYYFVGMIFAGYNIVGGGFLSATAKAKWASIVSILRGFFATSISAIILSFFLGMRGVWLGFVVGELLISSLMSYALRQKQ